MKKRKLEVSAPIFILVVSLYFTFFLNLKFWSFIAGKIELNGVTDVLFAVSLPFLMFAPLYLFFNLIVLPRIGKPLVMFLVICSAISDYALLNLGIVINSDMVQNIAQTTWREASDFLTWRAFLYVLIFGIAPVVLISRTKIIFTAVKKEVKYRFVGITLALLSFAIFTPPRL